VGRDLHDFLPDRQQEHHSFPGAAANVNTVYASFVYALQQVFHCGDIEGLVRKQRGDERGKDPAKCKAHSPTFLRIESLP
jgi:hypothetical protein